MHFFGIRIAVLLEVGTGRDTGGRGRKQLTAIRRECGIRKNAARSEETHDALHRDGLVVPNALRNAVDSDIFLSASLMPNLRSPNSVFVLIEPTVFHGAGVPRTYPRRVLA